ncbi:MAG: hypothetical protein KAX44_04965 [Candidatus Brocadiae bacterium]|nr:hypothetical protein [Candidatus Brocadiia bacterium]
MTPYRSRRLFIVLAAAALMAATTGCRTCHKARRMHTSAQFSSERVLHLIVVPKELPDGRAPTQQLADLLEEVAQRAGGYTTIEKVTGGWLPPGETEVVQERNDLLLVEGPPDLAAFLMQRLREDFQQRCPFVVSLPIRRIAVPEPTIAE